MQRPARLLFLLLPLTLFLPAGGLLEASGKRDRPSLRNLEGVIRIRGSEPFTAVVLQTPREEIRLEGKLTALLRRSYQNRPVRLRARKIQDAATALRARWEVLSLEPAPRN